MADNKISVEVELKSHLEKALQEGGKLSLSQSQKDRVTKHAQGAELALKSGDLDTFKQNFNGLIKIFKDAAAATGKLSEKFKTLQDRQAELSNKMNALTTKQSTLKGKVVGGKLEESTAQEMFKTSKNAQQIKNLTGQQMTRDEYLKLQPKLAETIASLGSAAKLTNEIAQNLGFADKNSALASNRYAKEEAAAPGQITKELNSIESEMTGTQSELDQVTNELKNLQPAADQAATSIQELYNTLNQIQTAGNKTVTNEKNRQKEQKPKTAAKTATVGEFSSNNSENGLGKAFKELTLYSVALKALKQAGQEAVKTVQELDKYLTEQAMVTGKTREETYGLLKSYQDLATQCGATTKEIAGVATEYMKQGKTIQETLVLTEAAVKAAKVARVSVGDSVNYLTTALNGFRLEAEEAMRVSDKFAAVAASSATDYDELAIALSKVASQANLAGMSIDYTTALLTKGLETTREAPETMGTALKTIIARMREMGDYGETLEGDTDINNVETQLAYVDIALRNTNGELRSTEDVLDELGKKWDTLNKNQQAAIAKALAGTRQQSRLIAMMEDYERVTELQEISQRSAGATAAQAGVYLEGMEAAMNNIQVAWEKIVMAITDSDVVISIFSTIGDALGFIGDFLSEGNNAVVILGVAAAIGTQILGNKMQELSYQQQLKTEQNLQIIREKKINLHKIKEAIATKTQTLELKRQTKESRKKLEFDKISTKLKEGEISDEEATLMQKQVENDLMKEEVQLQKEIDALDSERIQIESELFALGEQQAGSWTSIASGASVTVGLVGSLVSGSTAWLGILTAVGIALKAIPPIMGIINVLTKKQNIEELKGIPALIAKLYLSLSEQLGVPWGPIAATGIVAAVTAGLGIGAFALMGGFSTEPEKTTSDEVNDLSNEVYKLTEKANAIEKVTDSFDKLDNKLIKTNNDIKEMNSLLEQAADSLTEEEQKVYNSLATDAQKRKYLDSIVQQAKADADAKRVEQISLIQNMDPKERAKLLNSSSTDAAILQAQSAVYALANNKLYDYIDTMKENNQLTEEKAAAVESLTQSILENMSAEEAWQYVSEGGGKKVEALTDALKSLEVQATSTSGKLEDTSVASILTSDDYSLKDKVKAYGAALQAVQNLNDAAALSAFNEQFNEYEYFTRFSDNTLDFFSEAGLTTDKINQLYGSWETLQKKGVDISQDVFESRFDDYINMLAETQGDALAATKAVFGDYLDGSEETLNAFIAAYGDLVQVGILNMGQNMEKTQNSINKFYETASKWTEMSESEKTEFLQDNAELFQTGGEDLLKAFQSGDYARIEKELKNNEALQKQLEQRRKEVAQELMIEEARTGEERNEAYIAQLKEYEKYLNNVEDLFKASLELRLEQEQQQLDEYRSYLQDQKDALEESLNKRKEAYEKYFDAISEQEEDAQFDEQISTITSNIGKLASSSNMSAVSQTKELEQQLKDLEEERLKELRERAQEALIENIDNELSEISDKFDKLLENNQALLAAFRGDLDNPLEFVSQLLGNKISKGATANELENYIKTLESTYSNVLGGNVDWDNISVREENNQLFLTVNGQDILLNTSDEKNLYEAIKKALREIGAR